METASVASSTASYKNIPSTDLCNDPRYVSKLHKKIKTQFCERGVGNGIPTLTDDFFRLDRAIGSDNFDCDVWKFKQFFSGCGLTEKDLDVLFLLVDSDADGRVDLAETMLYMRKLFACNSHQFHEILKRLRSRKLDPKASCFLNQQATQPPSRAQVFDYLVSKQCACTESEAFFLLDYCTNAASDDDDNEGDEDADAACGGSPSLGASHADAELDVDYLSAALFTQHSLPSDILYPILLGKLADAAADHTKEFNGSLGVLKCCGISTRIVYPEGVEQQATSPSVASSSGGGGGSNAPTPTRGGKPHNQPDDLLLDQVAFRKFVQSFGGGLPTIEVDQLFDYIAPSDTDAVSVRYISRLVEAKVPLLQQEELMLVVNVTRSLVVTHVGLNALHQRLCVWGDAEIPLASFSGILRESGVGPHAVADVQLEHIWRQANTCVDVILLLRGTVTPTREGLMRQLYEKLDDDRDGLVEKLVMSEAFHCDGTVDLGRDSNRFVTKRDIEAYLQSLPGGIEESMTYAEFSYFWGNVSASVFDDSAFQMLLWKSYAMHKKDIAIHAEHAAAVRSASVASQHQQQNTGSVRRQHQQPTSSAFALPQSSSTPGGRGSGRAVVPPLRGLSEATSPSPKSSQRRFLRE